VSRCRPLPRTFPALLDLALPLRDDVEERTDLEEKSGRARIPFENAHAWPLSHTNIPPAKMMMPFSR
jgi:hypothetical protein